MSPVSFYVDDIAVKVVFSIMPVWINLSVMFQDDDTIIFYYI